MCCKLDVTRCSVKDLGRVQPLHVPSIAIPESKASLN